METAIEADAAIRANQTLFSDYFIYHVTGQRSAYGPHPCPSILPRSVENFGLSLEINPLFHIEHSPVPAPVGRNLGFYFLGVFLITLTCQNSDGIKVSRAVSRLSRANNHFLRLIFSSQRPEFASFTTGPYTESAGPVFVKSFKREAFRAFRAALNLQTGFSALPSVVSGVDFGGVGGAGGAGGGFCSSAILAVA